MVFWYLFLIERISTTEECISNTAHDNAISMEEKRKETIKERENGPGFLLITDD